MSCWKGFGISHLSGTFFLDEKEAQGDVALRPAPGNSAAEQRLESVLLMAGPAHVEKISI